MIFSEKEQMFLNFLTREQSFSLKKQRGHTFPQQEKEKRKKAVQ